MGIFERDKLSDLATVEQVLVPSYRLAWSVTLTFP